jgi:Homeodomain-like domain
LGFEVFENSPNLCGTRRWSMQKKYVVRLTDEERSVLQQVVKKLKGSGQKVRRAQILLKADANGPQWTDQQIAEAFSCRTQTVEGIRQRLVERGFQETLDGAQRAQPPTPKLLDGEQEARLIATRLGPPPKGYANWTLRLLARKVVELEIVGSVSHETVRRTLKKMG